MVACVRRHDGAVMVVFHLRGDLAALDLPLGTGAVKSTRRHELWRRSCCECFLAVPGEERYCEVNLCPDGCWNVYHFNGYRRDMTEVPGVAVHLEVAASQETLTLAATVSLDAMSFERKRLQVALSAVLLHRDGTQSYWALDHPGSQADFHDRRGFLYDLAESSAEGSGFGHKG